ncbi:MAG: NAD(P)-binding domain-containing protein [bacterium]|nr:NAD(P)-binding domain-containing protein [bacterium]
MKIGIIGSGNIGANVGKLLAQAGHEVFYSFSRSEEKLQQLATEAGDSSRWGTPAEAVAFADVIVLSPPYRELDNALSAAGSMAGKIVIDTVNPYTSTGPAYAEGGTAAEEIAGKLPGAKTVKVYNHIWYQHIANRHHENPPLVAFISGDDADAKAVATQIAADTGFFVWDLGDLYTARWTEPHGPLFNRPMTEAEARTAVADLPALR